MHFSNIESDHQILDINIDIGHPHWNCICRKKLLNNQLPKSDKDLFGTFFIYALILAVNLTILKVRCLLKVLKDNRIFKNNIKNTACKEKLLL